MVEIRSCQCQVDMPPLRFHLAIPLRLSGNNTIYYIESFILIIRQTANNARIRYHIEHGAKEPYVLGTIEEVTGQGRRKFKWRQAHKARGKLSRKITYIKDDPGRQMIGSFYPLTTEDW